VTDPVSPPRDLAPYSLPANAEEWPTGPAVMPDRTPQEPLLPSPVAAYVGLGSNIEPRLAHLQSAVDGLAALDGVVVVAVSRVYETDPVGPDQADFLNACVALQTTRTPADLLRACQVVEAEARRVRTQRWGPRTLDADVLLHGDNRVDTPELTVPHPRLWERPFVLIPLADVAPKAVPHPPVDPGVRLTTLRLVLPAAGPPGDVPPVSVSASQARTSTGRWTETQQSEAELHSQQARPGRGQTDADWK